MLQKLQGIRVTCCRVALCPRNSYARDDALLRMHRPERKAASIYIADSSPLRRDAVGKRVVMEGDVFAQLEPAAFAL